MEEKYGEVEEMNVCDNLGDHLVGNVYVKVRTVRRVRGLGTPDLCRLRGEDRLPLGFSCALGSWGRSLLVDFKALRCWLAGAQVWRPPVGAGGAHGPPRSPGALPSGLHSRS